VSHCSAFASSLARVRPKACLKVTNALYKRVVFSLEQANALILEPRTLFEQFQSGQYPEA
jgi:hypothetical protein